MRVNNRIVRVENLSYHDVVFIRLFHLDGYGIVDSINVDNNTITFSKLLTAKKDTTEWQRDVAENITLQFDREQMSNFGIRSFLDRIHGTRCPINVGDFLTPGDYICPDLSTDRISSFRVRDGLNDYLIMVRINGTTVRGTNPFHDRRFQLLDHRVLFESAIKVDYLTKDLLGIYEPGIDMFTGRPIESYSISDNCFQIKGEKFDIGGYREVQDYLVQGVLL